MALKEVGEEQYILENRKRISLVTIANELEEACIDNTLRKEEENCQVWGVVFICFEY